VFLGVWGHGFRFIKQKNIPCINEITRDELSDIIFNKIHNLVTKRPLDTNQIFLKVMEMIFKERIVSNSVDLLDILLKNFKFTDDKHWSTHDKPRL